MTHGLRRRDALLLAGALGASGGCDAMAQGQPRRAGAPQAPANVVLPVPVPCASRPGDIAGLLLEGSSNAAVLVFGQAFRAGDLPAGAALGCRRADGRPLPTQFDLKVRHPDGSARHGIVSIAVPALGRGDRLGLVLRRGEPAAGPALDLAAALAGRQAAVEVTPLTQGTPWRVDLLAAWAARREARPWQSGPLALQERLSLPVPPAAVGGVASMRLVVDLAVRSDGSLWIDPWMRNDIAMQPGGGTASYALRLTIDGKEALAAELPRHFQYQAFGRQRGGGRGGAAAPTAPFLRHDVTYLADAAAIPRYDQSTGADIRRLEDLARAMAEPAWDAPFNPRRIVTAMGTTGGRPDIGPVTGYQAFWLCAADPRAAAFSLGQAEAAGAVPWHHWDPGNSRRAAGWLDVRAWPGIWTDERGGNPPGGMSQQVSRETGWSRTTSHQPDLSYVPYLLTGRRAFLDGLQAQAAWNVVFRWPARRGAAPLGAPLRDVVVADGGEVRASAWSMRQIANAAWITPDDDVMRSYLRDVEATNWLWMRSHLREWTARQGAPHGWLPTVYGQGILAPWQQDYFASTLAMAARRGNDDARTCLRWMCNFLVGRFHAERDGFHPTDAVAYHIAIGPTEPNGVPPFHTWAAVGATTRERNWSSNGTLARATSDYPRWALQSLAQIVETLDDARARQAYLWLLGAGAPSTTPGEYALSAQLNIVPAGMPRIPAQHRRCAA